MRGGIGTHLCRTLPQRRPLEPAQDAAQELLAELGVDHLELGDVAEREGEVGRVGARARRARQEVLRDEADHLGRAEDEEEGEVRRVLRRRGGLVRASMAVLGVCPRRS